MKLQEPQPDYGLFAALSPVGHVKRSKNLEEAIGGLPPRIAEAWVGISRLFLVDALLDILADRLVDWVFDDERRAGSA